MAGVNLFFKIEKRCMQLDKEKMNFQDTLWVKGDILALWLIVSKG